MLWTFVVVVLLSFYLICRHKETGSEGEVICPKSHLVSSRSEISTLQDLLNPKCGLLQYHLDIILTAEVKNMDLDSNLDSATYYVMLGKYISFLCLSLFIYKRSAIIVPTPHGAVKIKLIIIFSTLKIMSGTCLFAWVLFLLEYSPSLIVECHSVVERTL